MKQKESGNLSGIEELKPLPARQSIGQHIFEHLRQAIIRGSLPAGDRLVENRLAEALGVSRTPVREAIHKLEREGLLSKQVRGGFIVLGLTRADVEETVGIRSVLEGYAARMAAVNYAAPDLIPLEEKIEEYRRHLTNGDLGALARINTEFHDLLYQLSRSPRLIKMINDLRDHIHRFRQIILRNRSLAEASHRDHIEMLAAIRNGDPDEVEALVRAHILKVKAALLAEFDRQSPL